MKKRVNRHPDHAKRHNTPSPNNQVIAAHLEELLTPVIFNQQAYYRQLGLRNRILNLSLMVAAVLTLLWRQVPSVQELTRLLEREDLLWCRATKIAQQSLSERLLEFPASIFERVFKDLLPVLQSSWQQRQKRPIPASISFASRHFDQIWVADGSTLEALFRKLKSLEDVKPGQLAGKICTVVDLITRLPVQVWFHTNPLASETKFEEGLLSLVSGKTLLLLDRGFYHFQFFEQLMIQQVDFITRLKAKASVKVIQVFTSNNSVKDQLIKLGTGRNSAPILTLRLISIRTGKTWYSYLTSVTDPKILPPYVVADLYQRRWRIEEAFNTVKRLLGLSYLWTGSINGVKLQVWATWLFYAVLVDLGDAVADELSLPFDRISLEMVYRGLYHFTVAYDKGKATDPIQYFADPSNQDLGVIKALRKTEGKLDLSPFPLPLN
ncbi:IS4 family transposase [Argonema antarcticum A004/B2]|nr:IS4 family transposase [Argonema antarcticum]MCL1470915.1 IS4 family transposase [Argonema antarcticum A004/B2]